MQQAAKKKLSWRWRVPGIVIGVIVTVYFFLNGLRELQLISCGM